MSVSAISNIANPAAADVDPERLAGNSNLSQKQKIAEASRQFEAILLRQILSETQKPVITSEFTDNSTAAGIYQDFIVNQMADSLSKSGTVGFSKIFEQQLSQPEVATPQAVHGADNHQAPKISSPHHHE